VKTLLKNSLRSRLWLIFAGAFFLRLLIILVTAWNRGPHFENFAIAENIVNGLGYSWDWDGILKVQPTALLPPIYTYFLVIFLYLFDDPSRWIYIAQALLNSLGIFPAFGIGKQLKDEKTGVWAASLYAFFPEIAVSPTKMISEPLFIPGILLGIWLYRSLADNRRNGLGWRPFFLFGLYLGVLTLIKTTGTLLLAACIICLLLKNRFSRTSLNTSLLILSGFIVAISPWSARNIIVMRAPIILGSNLGYNLWRGNHPWSKGTEFLNPYQTSEAKLPPEYKQYLQKNYPDTEVKLDLFFRNEAVRFIKENPQRYLSLVLKRALYFFTYDPTHPLTRNFAYLGGYLFVVIFGIWGGILAGKNKTFDCIFIIAPLLPFLFYIPLVMVPRFRIVMILVLLMLSSLSISSIIDSGIFKRRLADNR